MYASFDFAGIILDSACSANACISGEISFLPIFLDFCDGRRRGCGREKNVNNSRNYSSKKKFVTQSRTGLQIYEGHDDQLNRPGPMA
jgi:hypothetical protein